MALVLIHSRMCQLFTVVYLTTLLLSLYLNGMLDQHYEAGNTSSFLSSDLHAQQLRSRFISGTPSQPTSSALRRQAPRPLPANESFGACLLLLDENHRLTEWIAYHYHVLPLDYLVVGVDPNSKTSPHKILQHWRKHGLTIVEWDNKDIFKGKLWEYDNIVMKRSRAPHDHRQRQNMFVRNCLVHMKEMGRSWVILTDPDEYLVFNGPKGSEVANNEAQHLPYPGLEESSGTMIRFLKTLQEQPRNLFYKHSACISIPRMLFGANESLPSEVNDNVPAIFNGTKFDTLRYRKHIYRYRTHVSPRNGWSKSIVDVSRAAWSDFPTLDEAFAVRWKMNIHEPVPKLCPKPVIKNVNSLFLINHYIGSLESYSVRNDTDARAIEEKGRRTKEKWLYKASVADETDDNIRPWLSSFVEEYGPTQAQDMLADLV